MLEDDRETIRVCIIGATGHTGYVLEGIKKDLSIRIAGIARGSKGEEIKDFHNKLNKEFDYNIPLYDDYREMLRVVKPDIAAIACYFVDHARVTVKALERSINVFVEKPIATTFEGLEQIKNVYKKAGVNLAVMFGTRYYPWFYTAREKVLEGAVGTVRLLFAQKSYKLGSRGIHYQKRDTYGGTIPWVGSHAIDWLYWFSGEKFESVVAHHSKKYNRNHGELEVTAVCQFKMTNEVYGMVSIDYLRPEAALGHGDDRLRVVGTKGIIEVANNKVFFINKDCQGLQELPVPSAGGQIFLDFVKQIRGRGSCLVSVEDVFYITDSCLKARQSADEQRIIYFNKD